MWVLLDLLTRKIKIRCIKSTVLGTLPLWNSKDPDLDQTVGPDPYQIEKQDTDPYQSKNQDLDPYENGLDLQHWFQEVEKQQIEQLNPHLAKKYRVP